MAVVDSYYRNPRTAQPSAFTAYWSAFIAERSAMNRALMEQSLKDRDPRALLEAEAEARASAAELGRIRARIEQDDRVAVNDLLKEAMVWGRTVEVANVQASASLAREKLRADLTLQREAARSAAARAKAEALEPGTIENLRRLPTSTAQLRTDNPSEKLANYENTIDASLAANGYPPRGSQQYDRIVLEASRAAATGNPAAGVPADPLLAAAVAAKHGLGRSAEEAENTYANKWRGFTEEDAAEEATRLRQTYGAGGGRVGGGLDMARSVGVTDEALAGRSSATTSATSATSGATSPATGPALSTPAMALSKVSGPAALVRELIAAPTNTAALDQLDEQIAALNRQADDYAAERRRGATPADVFAGRLPNYVLANPFQVKVAPDDLVRRTRELARLDPLARDEVTQALVRGGSAGGARADIAASGGSANRSALTNDPGGFIGPDAKGSALADWLDAALDASAGKSITGSGGFTYFYAPDGSVTITGAPPEFKAAIGRHYTARDTGKAATAIRGELGAPPSSRAAREAALRLLGELPEEQRRAVVPFAAALVDGDVTAAKKELAAIRAPLSTITTGDLFATALDRAAAVQDAKDRRAALLATADLGEALVGTVGGEKAGALPAAYLRRYNELAAKGDLAGLTSDARALAAAGRRGFATKAPAGTDLPRPQPPAPFAELVPPTPGRMRSPEEVAADIAGRTIDTSDRGVTARKPGADPAYFTAAITAAEASGDTAEAARLRAEQAKREAEAKRKPVDDLFAAFESETP